MYREGGQHVAAVAAAGRLMPDEGKATTSTPYDLASLTKTFVATAALRAHEAGELDLDARTDSVMGDVRGGVAGASTIRSLFSHRAGLGAWGGLYLDVPHEPGSAAARRWIVSEASRRPSEVPPPAQTYSDLGYIVAGEVLCRATGQRLDEIVDRHVLTPLGIQGAVYYAGALSADKRMKLSRNAAPTETCEWRGRLIRGEVHDENAAALGGVAGHAGMFGDATGVARLGMEMLQVLAGRSNFLSQQTLKQALAEQPGGSHRFGWDSKTQASSAGKRLGKKTFGHLGFTGTSIWADPKRDLVVVLLTNRVYPSRANEKIKGFRPAFHDGLVAAFDASK